jgi:acyl carrier protein
VNDTAVREAVFKTLRRIAPEVDPRTLAAERPLRDQVDLDSMDWLNFLVGLHNVLNVDIPESDYRKLYTLNDLFGYLRERLPPGAG